MFLCVVWSGKNFVTVTRYFSSRVLMTFSFCSSSPASQCHSHCGQMRLRVLFLTLLPCIARGRAHALLYLLLSSAFLLNAAVLADLAWYLAVGGSASVESFALLTFSCFKHVWHRFLGCLSLELLTLSFSHARWLEICNTWPGDCASVCSKSAFTAPGD